MRSKALGVVDPNGKPYPHQVNESELESSLDTLSYEVLRLASTEPAFTGEYPNSQVVGVYHCKAFGHELFCSEAKLHSGCGWPSFYQSSGSDAMLLVEDHSYGVRVEARCANCGSHLGHVFTGEGFDVPTDERWCINSVALRLEPRDS